MGWQLSRDLVVRDAPAGMGLMTVPRIPIAFAPQAARTAAASVGVVLPWHPGRGDEALS